MNIRINPVTNQFVILAETVKEKKQLKLVALHLDHHGKKYAGVGTGNHQLSLVLNLESK